MRRTSSRLLSLLALPLLAAPVFAACSDATQPSTSAGTTTATSTTTSATTGTGGSGGAGGQGGMGGMAPDGPALRVAVAEPPEEAGGILGRRRSAATTC